MASDTAATYARPTIGRIYDALNALLWFPHGSGRLRAALVDVVGIQPGERVLELGCGTGQVTAGDDGRPSAPGRAGQPATVSRGESPGGRPRRRGRR